MLTRRFGIRERGGGQWQCARGLELFVTDLRSIAQAQLECLIPHYDFTKGEVPRNPRDVYEVAEFEPNMDEELR